MQTERIRNRDPLWQGLMPGHQLRRRNNLCCGRSQRGHVQRLADVASGLRTAGVLMKERAADSEIQQRQARENRQRSPESCST